MEHNLAGPILAHFPQTNNKYTKKISRPNQYPADCDQNEKTALPIIAPVEQPGMYLSPAMEWIFLLDLMCHNTFFSILHSTKEPQSPKEWSASFDLWSLTQSVKTRIKHTYPQSVFPSTVEIRWHLVNMCAAYFLRWHLPTHRYCRRHRQSKCQSCKSYMILPENLTCFGLRPAFDAFLSTTNAMFAIQDPSTVLNTKWTNWALFILTQAVVEDILCNGRNHMDSIALHLAPLQSHFPRNSKIIERLTDNAHLNFQSQIKSIKAQFASNPSLNILTEQSNLFKMDQTIQSYFSSIACKLPPPIPVDNLDFRVQFFLQNTSKSIFAHTQLN